MYNCNLLKSSITEQGRLILAAIIINAVLLTAVHAVSNFNPACPNICGSKLREPCVEDRDCLGEGSVCTNERCACHAAYRTSGNKCSKLPNKVGDSCSRASGCRSPLVCTGRGRCECGSGYRARGKSCSPSGSSSVSCSSNADCTSPFTECGRGGRCTCMSGFSSGRGGACTGSGRCPDGSRGGKACSFKATPSVDMLENTESTGGGKYDTCAAGSFCVSAGDAGSNGFCCQQSCPFGGVPNTKASCDPGSSAAAGRCPTDTHFCTRVVGPSFAASSCCPKPCGRPGAVFTDGKCLQSAVHADGYHIDEQLSGNLCTSDTQCDGGVSMKCTSDGLCKCRDGYAPASDQRKVGLTCVKECRQGEGAVDDLCMGLSSVGGPCYMDWQCAYKTPNTICHLGKCACACRFRNSGGKCVQTAVDTSCSDEGGDSNSGALPDFGGAGRGGGGFKLGGFLEKLIGQFGGNG